MTRLPNGILIFCTPHISDAFLHQIHSGTARLKFLVDKVNEIMANKVEGTIEKIRDMFFFDYVLAFSKSWVRQIPLPTLILLHRPYIRKVTAKK